MAKQQHRQHLGDAYMQEARSREFPQIYLILIISMLIALIAFIVFSIFTNYAAITALWTSFLSIFLALLTAGYIFFQLFFLRQIRHLASSNEVMSRSAVDTSSLAD